MVGRLAFKTLKTRKFKKSETSLLRSSWNLAGFQSFFLHQNKAILAAPFRIIFFLGIRYREALVKNTPS